MVPNRAVGTEDAKIDVVVNCCIVTWWNVEHGSGASNLECALSWLLILPDPPHSVDIAVVQPEERLVGAIVELNSKC